MDGVKRAAILLLGMGEENAAEVIRFLEPKEVQKVGTAMSATENVSRENMKIVLNEFLNEMENMGSLSIDPEEYLKKVLIAGLGEDRAIPVLDTILVNDKDGGLNQLKWLDGRLISDVIRNEHPQIIATILTYLDSEQAAEVVKYFSAEKRAEILLRMCNIDTVKPEAISDLGQVIEKQLSGQKLTKKSSIGGIKSTADVINYLESSIEAEVMDKIADLDPELSEKIKDKMFVFDNLVDMDDKSVQTLLREVSSEQLMIALKGATERVKQKIFDNMSKRAADLLKDDIEMQGLVKVSDVEKAQREILAVARNMAEQGLISLGTKGSEEMI